MKLHVQNLGPIKEATIDLSKRFYTFVGYNNSGKTYLANLLWCVFNYHLEESLVAVLIEEGKEIAEGQYELIITQESLDRILNKFALTISEIRLPDALNISKEHFVVADLKLKFETSLIDINIDLLQKRFLQKDEFHFVVDEDSLRVRWGNIQIEGVEVKEYSTLSLTIWFLILENLLKITDDFSIDFLPTERITFMSFYKYFFSIEKERREEISRFIRTKKNFDLQELKEISESLYTESSNNLLKKLYDLDAKKEIENHNEQLLLALEDVMGGEINLYTAKSNGATNFQFKINSKNEFLKLPNASSSVNQLSPLHLYWKYWAGKSDNFLIIDEPEQNLHPENQIKLTELLIQFANKNNNRVLIATHSPLIAEVINNYLVLGQLDDKETAREKLGLAKDAVLTPEDTGIYFFTGDSVQEYQISDYGTVFQDFKAAQDKIWRAGVELGDFMYEQIQNKRKNESQ